MFPISATRWIAVIDAPEGLFWAEATSLELVATEVARVILEVLGGDLTYALVEKAGQPWSEHIARAQLARLIGEGR